MAIQTIAFKKNKKENPTKLNPKSILLNFNLGLNDFLWFGFPSYNKTTISVLFRFCKILTQSKSTTILTTTKTKKATTKSFKKSNSN